MKTKDVALPIFTKATDPDVQAAIDRLRVAGLIIVRESDLDRVARALNVELVRE